MIFLNVRKVNPYPTARYGASPCPRDGWPGCGSGSLSPSASPLGTGVLPPHAPRLDIHSLLNPSTGCPMDPEKPVQPTQDASPPARPQSPINRARLAVLVLAALVLGGGMAALVLSLAID